MNGKPRGALTELNVDGVRAIVIDVPALRLPDALTPSERAIVELLTQGASNEEIARARDSRPRTVANQIASVFRKLGVNSRAELVARLLSSDE